MRRLFRPTSEYQENRVFRVLGYCAYISAGICSYIFTSRALETIELPWMKQIWALFFLLGGLFSLSGVLIKDWNGEIVGVPLMAGSSLFYACVVFLAYFNLGEGAYLIIASLISGEGFLLVDRYVRLLRLSKFAQGRPVEEEPQ